MDSKIKHIGLQFFAEPDGGDNTPPADTSPETATDTTTTEQPAGGKTFTQEEVNRMLANEKRQGRQAALKALGLDPSDKNAEKNAKAILDAQKTQSERDADALKQAQTAQAEAEAKAATAERKLSVLSAGCNVDYLDEVMALAAVKVTDTVTFDDALKAVKEKFPSFFSASSDSGTGGGQGHKRTDPSNKPGSLGSRLAQSRASSNPTTNPYFKS